MKLDILIIEDSKAEAQILAQTLERIMDERPVIHHGCSLGEGTRMLDEKQDDLDLVFLDLRLSDSPEWRNTYDAVAPYARKVPVIVLSGDNDREVMREVLKNGAEDYIVKGSRRRHVDALKEAIEFALLRHHQVKKLAEENQQEADCIHWLSGGYSVE